MEKIWYFLGTILDFGSALLRLNSDPNLQEDFLVRNNMEETFVFSTADDTASTSGSPVLNGSGEVIAIHTSSWRPNSDGPDDIVNQSLLFHSILRNQ